MLRWLRRRILLAVPHCKLWRPCIQIDGWEFVLWPSWRVGYYDVLFAIMHNSAVIVSLRGEGLTTPPYEWKQVMCPVKTWEDSDED